MALDPYSLWGANQARLEELARQGVLTRYAGEQGGIDPGYDGRAPTFNYDLGGGRNQAITMGPGGAVVSDPYTPTGDRNMAAFGLLAGGLGAYSGMAGSAGAGSVGGSTTAGSALPAAGAVPAAGGIPAAGAVPGAAAGGAGLLGSAGQFVRDNAGMLAAGAGALAGGLNKTPDTLSSSSSIDPAVKPQILNYMQTARERMDGDANHLQNAGYSAIQNAAGNQGLLNQAQGTLGQFMGGGLTNPYSGSNPYMQGMIDRASSDLTDKFRTAVGSRDAQFANANAFGGSAYQQARQQDEKNLMQGLGDIQNQFRFQDYGQQAQLAENQLGRQMSATMFSPSMDAARYTAGSQLLGAGDNRAGWQQQNWQNYAGAMNTGMGIGSQNTQANPYQTNRLASALGGALGAYQIFRGM